MADTEKDQKTEEPTQRRLSQARSQGQVFKSQEVLSVGMLLIGFSVLAFGAPWGFEQLRTLMASVLINANVTVLNRSAVHALASDLGFRTMVVLLPLMCTLMVTGVALNLTQSGWNFTFKPLEPSASKINPIKGVSRIFSSQGLFQLFKSILKIAIVAPLAYFHIRDLLLEIVLLSGHPLETILYHSGLWVAGLVYKMIVILIFLSAIDFVYERWKFKRDMKMTKEEVKDERKQAEGDPKVKRERHKLAMKLLRRPRMDRAVSEADVVVTNPTHYAVALRYDATQAPAPRVLVKGLRKRALRIRALAAEHDVPVIEDPPLARTLYASVPEGHEIPEELYHAVATLLATIYRDRDRDRRRPGGS